MEWCLQKPNCIGWRGVWQLLRLLIIDHYFHSLLSPALKTGVTLAVCVAFTWGSLGVDGSSCEDPESESFNWFWRGKSELRRDGIEIDGMRNTASPDSCAAPWISHAGSPGGAVGVHRWPCLQPTLAMPCHGTIQVGSRTARSRLNTLRPPRRDAKSLPGRWGPGICSMSPAVSKIGKKYIDCGLDGMSCVLDCLTWPLSSSVRWAWQSGWGKQSIVFAKSW